MSPRSKIFIAVLTASLLTGGVWLFLRNAARRAPIAAALEFSRAVSARDASRILELTKLPAFLADKTPAEQSQLLLELLASEISPEGTAALVSDGQFGPLKTIFPDDATAWATSFNINPDDCVAFRMEREGIRAELVLLKSGDKYQIVRCNNVRQMTGELSEP